MLSLIKKIESSTVSVKKIIILFATSIVLRGFFENFTNSNVATGLTNLTDIFLHYPLWYVGLFLSIIIILYLFTKQSLLKIANVVAIGSFGILIGPLIDIFVYGFWGHPYNFIQNTYPMLFQHFSTLTFSTHAISLGIKIETVVLIISTGMYVYLRSNKKRSLKAFFAGFLSYVVIFFFLSLPTHTMSIFTTLSGEYITPTTEATVLFYTPPNYKINTTEDLLVLNKKSPEQQYFSQKISIVFTLIILLSLMFLLFIKNKNKFIAILKIFASCDYLIFMLLLRLVYILDTRKRIRTS